MKRKFPSLLILGFLSLFVVAAAVASYAAYQKSYAFFLEFNMAQIDGLAIHNSTPAVNPEGTPNPTSIPELPTGPTIPPWDGASRVTVLVMGLDYRDWEANDGPPRTDTMILLTIDPLTKTAGILNVPRDMWVNIPGFNYAKLNTAYPLGMAYNVPPEGNNPGGGPGLAMKTVENLLGVPIDYYAIIDFYAFEQFIDELGGIYVDVPAEIKVDPLGEHNTVVLPAGRQLLSGPVALAYARNRKTANDDFDRSVRQQEVILAIADRVLEIGPAQLAAKAPALYNKLEAGIHTNLALDDALRLGWLALEVPRTSIQRASIAPPKCVIFAKSPDGLDILLPVPDQVNLVRDSVFASSNMASPVLSSADERANMEAEGASIVVSNGTYVEGLANKTQDYLKSQGAKVVGTQNNENSTYTRIIDYTGKPYTDRYLVNLMGITRYDYSFQYDPNSQVDVLIILGDMWANSNPMP